MLVPSVSFHLSLTLALLLPCPVYSRSRVLTQPCRNRNGETIDYIKTGLLKKIYTLRNGEDYRHLLLKAPLKQQPGLNYQALSRLETCSIKENNIPCHL
jgi:hypothetical protein